MTENYPIFVTFSLPKTSKNMTENYPIFLTFSLPKTAFLTIIHSCNSGEVAERLKATVC